MPRTWNGEMGQFSFGRNGASAWPFLLFQPDSYYCSWSHKSVDGKDNSIAPSYSTDAIFSLVPSCASASGATSPRRCLKPRWSALLTSFLRCQESSSLVVREVHLPSISGINDNCTRFCVCLTRRLSYCGVCLSLIHTSTDSARVRRFGQAIAVSC